MSCRFHRQECTFKEHPIPRKKRRRSLSPEESESAPRLGGVKPEVQGKGTQNRDNEISDLDEINSVVAPHGQALVHLYFRIVHPSFPILHKKVFLEKYERTHREFSPPLLAAVYILALSWWSYSSELAMLPKPDVPTLEKLALNTVGDVIHRSKLSTIQAGLLLLQRPEGDSWALTTQLVSIGQDLGLHLDCSRWKIPSWGRGVRKWLGWALYMQDKWGSLVHGRPSHITEADWRVGPVTEDVFPESAADEDDEEGSTEVKKGRVLFCEMTKLTEILTTILSSFYSLQAEEDARQNANIGVRWLLERAKPIQLRLKEWYAHLQEALKMESVKMKKVSSTGVDAPAEHVRLEAVLISNRLFASRILRCGDVLASTHPALPTIRDKRSPHPRLSHCRPGEANLCHRLRQVTRTSTPPVVLVLRLQIQFRTAWNLCVPALGHSPLCRRNGMV